MNIGGDAQDQGDQSQGVALTLIKGIDILEALAERPGLTVAQIAARLGLNRTTTHRLVQTLVRASYLQTSPDGRHYEIGLGLLPLAAAHLDRNRIRIVALPYLNQLAQESGERANLGVLFRGQVLYLAGVEKPSLPNVYSRFGKVAPVHCCSLGKAMLACMAETEVRRLLGPGPLERHTARTITDPEALLADLAETRRRGYAIDGQEHMETSWCVAAPVRGGGGLPVAAIGVSGGQPEGILGMGTRVKAVAEVISHVLSPGTSS